MIDYDDLCRAAFDNDSQAVESSFEEVCKRLDIDPVALSKAAEQRALRSVLFDRGPDEIMRVSKQAYSGTYSVEELTPEEREKIPRLVGVWMDGAACALRIKLNEE